MIPGRQDSLHVDFTLSREFHPEIIGRIRNLLEFAAIEEALTGEVGVWLCTDDEIADLHLRFMDIPGATDVITFPEDSEPGGYLGDIAVSIDTAAVQAGDAGHSTAREIAYLCLHGVLHIAGYDDLDETAREEMIDRQDALMRAFEAEHPDEW
jgi:probable rRNA maturation factor